MRLIFIYLSLSLSLSQPNPCLSHRKPNPRLPLVGHRSPAAPLSRRKPKPAAPLSRRKSNPSHTLSCQKPNVDPCLSSPETTRCAVTFLLLTVATLLFYCFAPSPHSLLANPQTQQRLTQLLFTVVALSRVSTASLPWKCIPRGSGSSVAPIGTGGSAASPSPSRLKKVSTSIMKDKD